MTEVPPPSNGRETGCGHLLCRRNTLSWTVLRFGRRAVLRPLPAFRLRCTRGLRALRRGRRLEFGGFSGGRQGTLDLGVIRSQAAYVEGIAQHLIEGGFL